MSRKREEINKMAKKIKPNEFPPEQKTEPQILVNDYGATRDSTVVVEEETRTVLLTDNETIIIEKEQRIDVVPKNRPRRIYAGMWGSAETATVGLGMLAILTVIILVVLVVLPAQKELEKNKIERDRLETELITTRGKYGDITSTETQVTKLIASVNDFEARFLPTEINGRNALYQRINGLIGAYGLINTTGPEYAPMEIADGRRSSAETEGGREKFQSLFPGDYVTMTVQGSYQNLRRFIRDIETSDQFVVISAIEFQPAESEDRQQTTSSGAAQASINNVRIIPQQGQKPQNINPPNQNFPSPNDEEYQNPNLRNPNPNGIAPGISTVQTQTTAARPAAPRGKTRGETVSLHLEMAAYFRRPNVSQAAVGVAQQ
jgi:hypothetical protein